MMVNSIEIKKIVRNISVYLVEQVMKYKNLNRDEAVECLMQSSCYDALMNYETDLYLESREAIWSIFKEELNGDPYKMLAL